jgi:hypothetical protein
VAAWFVLGALLLCSFVEISDLPMPLELGKQIIGRMQCFSICLSCGLWYVPDSCSIGITSKAFLSCFRINMARLDILILNTIKASLVACDLGVLRIFRSNTASCG